jgi:hypothetical protein
MSIEPAIAGALAAVLGSLVGGSASITTAWLTQRTQSRRELVSAEIRKREQLYTEFIAECSRLAIDAYANSLQRAETLLPAYALINRIRLVSSEEVLLAADRAIRRISGQYFERNLTLDELRELTPMASADPLKPFSEACRKELLALRTEA